MSDAQDQKDPVKQHFEDGQLKRLDLTMLPRDANRSLGTLRAVICKSFNYCKQYPAKLELFIVVMKYATQYAMYWQQQDGIRREEAQAAVKETRSNKMKIAEAQAKVNTTNVTDTNVARIEDGVAYNSLGQSLGMVEV